MWFARLFGGRDDGMDDELPTAVAPPSPPPSTSVTTTRRPAPSQDKAAAAGAVKPKGFDPYNSGAYDRRNAWESVKRRS